MNISQGIGSSFITKPNLRWNFMNFHRLKQEIFHRLIIISVIKFLRDESVQMMHFYFDKKVSNKCDDWPTRVDHSTGPLGAVLPNKL